MFRARFRDELRYNRIATGLFATAHHLRGLFTSGALGKSRAFHQVYRYAPPGSFAESRALKRLHDSKIVESDSGWGDHVRLSKPYGTREEEPLTRTLVLKPPGENGEKGILLTSFEYNWLRLLRNPLIWKSISENYDIVLSTSSSPTSYDLLGMALEQNHNDPVYVMSCRYEEIPKFEAFHSRVRCLPMLPCDWLEPTFYQPIPHQERSIDILMVAGWNPVKRHWHFFEALRELPKDTR